MDKGIEKDLLDKLKTSIGIISDNGELDSFYRDKLQTAVDDYKTEDISENVLTSDYGKSAIVLYATLLLKGADIATNPSIIFARNKLSLLTKGERKEDVDGV